MVEAPPPKYDAPRLEEEVLERWRRADTFRASIENRDVADRFVFLEGPPTANGMPHPGHVLTRTLKDTVCRYKTMRGHRVARKAGWDCHGLPVRPEHLSSSPRGSRESVVFDRKGRPPRPGPGESCGSWAAVCRKV